MNRRSEKFFQPSEVPQLASSRRLVSSEVSPCGICVPKDLQNTTLSDAGAFHSISGSIGASAGEALKPFEWTIHTKKQLIRVEIPLPFDPPGGVFRVEILPLLDSSGGVFRVELHPLHICLVASMRVNRLSII